MQVMRPNEGVYLMPVVWYFAPEGAKTLQGVNAFTSGVWDRDKLELAPTLGAQKPYSSPYYNGKNQWGYTGQCQIGTPEQFQFGLTQADLEAPTKPLPFCCDGIGPLWFDCPFYPEGLPSHLVLFMTQIFPGPWPFPELLEETILDYEGNCNYIVRLEDNPPYYSGAFWSLSLTAGNSILELVSFHPPWSQRWTGLHLIDYPLQMVATTHTGTPPADFFSNLVTLYQYPFNPMTQTIVLAGDVNGSADLVTSGCTIINALANVVGAGSAGDATHVPQITIDSKGRVIALANVAIAAGAVSIGDAIGGSTPTAVLMVDGGGNLADTPNLEWSGAALVIVGSVQATAAGVTAGLFGDGASHVAALATGGAAANLTDGVNTLILCDGTNSIGYNPTTVSDWAGPPPSDALKAIDRLAAWMQSNFPGLPKP
jgi:hypothetical protein